jgi:eukaryotic-like serine/threonine-protein kinase
VDQHGTARQKPRVRRSLRSSLLPPPTTGGLGSGFGLPHELLALARGRLKVVAWLTLFGTGISLLLPLARLRDRATLALEAPVIVTMGIGAAMAGLTLWLLRFRRGSATYDLCVGLVFEVVLGYVLAIGGTMDEAIRHGHAPQLTWAAALVILFALIVPSPPAWALVTSLVTGTASVVGVAVAAHAGVMTASAAVYGDVATSSLIAAGVAYFGAKVTFGLSRDYGLAARAGSYRLVEPLGAGGMGEVWLAEHEVLARPAAIKLLRPSVPNALSLRGAHERFRREACATSRLRSPHTVEIYDYGITDDGTLFYAMELLTGCDLDTLISKRGPIPPERVVYILLQVACSLAEAHASDMVHRDVKPANIFLCRAGLVSDFVKVLDFGLVKAHELCGGCGGPGLTLAENILGTPAFMAPEQITAEQPLTAASDIYSFGCVAYFLLTGRFPFTGPTSMAVMVQHVTAPPLPLASVAPFRVPAELDALIGDCLAKDPLARPRSMVAVHERLSRVPLGAAWSQARANAWWLDWPAATAASVGAAPANDAALRAG